MERMVAVVFDYALIVAATRVEDDPEVESSVVLALSIELVVALLLDSHAAVELR